MSPRHRSIDEIEHDIARTRAQLSATLGWLRTQLAPARFIQKGGKMIDGLWRNREIRFGSAHADPIALVLIGLGLGWLVAANTGFFSSTAPPGEGAGAPPSGPASEPIRPIGERAFDAVERHPLLLGLAGLAAGAVIAALTPTSRSEREIAVRVREDLWDKAEELGHCAAVSIRNIGEAPRHAPPDA